MSHPKNRRERFEIGCRKGIARAKHFTSHLERVRDPEFFKAYCRRFREIAKPCSCQMCRNPRRSVFYKGKGKLTMQERKFKEIAGWRSGSVLGS
jgi:hypothetical protein